MKNLFEYGYRFNKETCEFNDSIWFFGCSNVYVFDLLEDQTAAAYLEKITNVPVINLGICGGNVFNIKHNLSVLLESYTPKAIILAWPRPTRWTDPDGFNWGVWYMDVKPDEEVEDPISRKKVFLNQDRFKEYKELLLSDKISEMTNATITDIKEMVKEYTSIEFAYTSPKLPPPVQTNKIHFIDSVPDGKHPGPKTNMKAAVWLAEQLNIPYSV
jgi:hypothetical protein